MQTLRLAVWIHVLFLVVLVCGFAPAPIDRIATFALLIIFLPQFLVAYKLGGFSPDVGSIREIIVLTVVSYIVAFPFSLGYAFFLRWIIRRIRRSRHDHDESHASI